MGVGINNYKCIVFDFDMTLVNTELGSIYCYKKAIRKAGGVFEEKNVYKYMGEFLDKTYERIENPLITEKEFEELFYYYSHKKMAVMSHLYPEVRSVLNELKKTHILAIVTNKDMLCVEQIMKIHNIDLSIFSCIISCDEVSERKPHPQGLELCMEKIGVFPEQCLYVGDSANDMIFAENAKVKGIRIIRDGNMISNNNVICELSNLL